MLLGVSIHEGAGHCLFYNLFGSSCSGIVLKFDGMGWASAAGNIGELPVFNQVMILIAGVLMTSIFGIIGLILAWVFRKKLFLSISFLLLSVGSILDGAPYFFWNSLQPVGNGDVARILLLIPEIKWVLMGIGLILMVGSIFILNYLLLKIGGSWASKSEGLKKVEKLIFILTIFIIQSIAWFIFDYNQLIEGIGILPNVFGVLITLISLIMLSFFIKIKPIEYENSLVNWKSSVIISWITLFIIILIIGFFFQGFV